MKKEIKYDKEQLNAVFDQNPTVDSLLITSDGNVFHNDKKSESYCKSHCANIRGEFRELTRSEFEGQKEKSTTETPKKVKEDKNTDWRKGKMDDLIEFAKESGLEVEKKVGQSKADLVLEIEAFIANKEVGGNEVTNHQTQE